MINMRGSRQGFWNTEKHNDGLVLKRLVGSYGDFAAVLLKENQRYAVNDWITRMCVRRDEFMGILLSKDRLK